MDRFCTIADLEGGFPRPLLRHASVVARIDSFLEDLNVEKARPIPIQFTLNDYRESTTFHPSTIGSLSGKSLCGRYPMGCGRKMFYEYTGAESRDHIEPRVRRIFDLGSSIHAQLQAYLDCIAELSEGTETFVPEARISPNKIAIADEFDVSGSCDGIYTIAIPDLAMRFGLEFKSINDAGYQKTASAHPEHVMQGTVYQKCLDLPFMVFVYYNKNDCSMSEFVQVFDEHRWNAITEKLSLVRELAMRDQLPDREDGWHCSMCKYKIACKPPKKTRVAASNLFKKSRRADG